MNNVEFDEWAAAARAQLQKAIHDHAAKTGKYPVAILAGGEYVVAIHRDPERRNFYTVDDTPVWRGIPFVRCSLINKVVLVGEMETVQLPPVPDRRAT